MGPTLCFRGLDNPAYYRLDAADPGQYIDTTGCGNSLNAGDPRTLQLIMDSLRYWLTEMRVDGFRFDLAPALARQDGAFEKRSAFLDMVSQDPVVSRAKLIAEPWDVGQMDSYDIGGFSQVGEHGAGDLLLIGSRGAAHRASPVQNVSACSHSAAPGEGLVVST